MRGLLLSLLSASLGAAMGSCAPDDPETELRAFVAAAETAAEARDTGFFREAVSASYADRRGQSRDDVINVIRGVFLANATVEVVSRVETIALTGEDVATVTLRAALVGKAQGASVLDIDADLQRFELELVRESGSWRVIGADWERLSTVVGAASAATFDLD
jgi:hypothetical protein